MFQAILNICSQNLFVFLLLTLLFFLILKYARNGHYNYPPGPVGFPIYGFSPNLGETPYKVIDKWSQEHGEVFSVKIAGRRYIILNSYDAIKEAYITDGSNYVDRPQDFTVMGSYFKFKAMAFINGGNWKSQRKILTSSIKFLNREIDSDGTTVLESRISNAIGELMGKLQGFNSRPHDIYNLFANSTIDVVSSLVCDEPLATTQPEIAESILHDARLLFTMLPPTEVVLAGLIVKIMHNICGNKKKNMRETQEKQLNLMNVFIKQHQKQYDPNNIRDYIDMYLAEQQKFQDGTHESEWFSIENLSLNMLMFYVAGTDTTSGVMNWTTFLLAKYQNVQKQCQEELNSTIGANTIIKFSDRKRLPFVEATLNEILRYSILGPLPQPRSNLKATSIRGYNIPENTHFITNLWSASRDAKVWPNPHAFDPNNFYERNVPRDLTSLPFSTGKRICPGESLARMELFLYFTNLLQKFTVSLHGSTEENIVGGFTRMLAPFNIICTPRRQS